MYVCSVIAMQLLFKRLTAMKTIQYLTEDKSLNIKLVFSRVRPLIHYKHIGKSWPITTQCLLFVNERLVNCGEAIKHANDDDNTKLGAMIACKKALQKMNLKFVRKELWQLFHSIDWN